MAMLNFKMGLHENLPESYKAGTVYVTTDEQGMYVDISDSSRIRINQIISYNTFQDFSTALNKAVPPFSTEAFYYIIEENALLKYNETYGNDYDPDGSGNTAAASGKWVQINSTAEVESALAAVSKRVTDLEAWKAGMVTWQTAVNEDIADLKKVDGEQNAAITALQEADKTLQSNINAEAQARAAADQTLQTNINAEAAERARQDGLLNQAITGVAEDLSDEVTNRSNEVTRLEGLISANTQAIATEKSRAEGVEAGLRTDVDENADAIADEIERATAAEQKNAQDITKLGEDLSDEVDRAKGIEAGLRTDLNNEVTRAKAAEEAIYKVNADKTTSGYLADEIARAKAAEAALDKKIGEANADLTELDNKITGVAEDLATEIDRAKKAEKANADAIVAEKERAMAAEATNAQAITAEANRAKGVENNLLTQIQSNDTDISNLDKRITKNAEDLAQEKLDRAAADQTLQTNINNLEKSLINKIQAADALVYKGSIDSLSKLPAINATDKAGNKLSIGWTYKVTKDIKLADATNVITSSDDDYIRIGDILIANGTETNGAISSNLTWDHIPSGYVADYNPALAADSATAGGAHLTLTKGDDSVDTIVFKVAEGNESLKVSGDVNTIIFSMEWGSFN